MAGRFSQYAQLHPLALAAAALATSLAVWLVGSLFDWIRLKLFKLIRIPALSEALGRLAVKLFDRLQRLISK